MNKVLSMAYFSVKDFLVDSGVQKLKGTGKAKKSKGNIQS